jgi:hypothetical protein
MEVEQTLKTSLPTLQAALVLNIRLNMCSMDRHGMQLNVKAMAMAHELKLFRPSSQFKSMRKQICYEFTSWCLYFWTT